MPRRKKSAHKPIEQYEHTGQERLNNPPVGLVKPENDPEGPRKGYQYDPHLDPASGPSARTDNTDDDLRAASNYRNMLYDVFICHASEDKDEIVRPIAAALAGENIVVWYDEFELRPGDSLRESIDRGLAKSRHGIVVLSQAFFEKRWPQRELSGLVARQMRGDERVIIPLWHGVTRDDVLEFSPPLSDLVAIPTSRGVSAVCQAIVRAVRPQYSPLIIARDELIAFGMEPPVISDEWWLDVIEASNRVSAAGAGIPERSQWGRWSFPLPNDGARGEARGVRLAWTAMQLRWENEADVRRITQITEPSGVLEFVCEMPGLREICYDFPDWLAAYAPQLTIPGLGGEFEILFDELASRRSPRDELILRCEAPAAMDAALAACQFVQGSLFGPSPKFYNTFDYLIWLLSRDSGWLPELYRRLLHRGMREWTVWATAENWHKGQTKFVKWLVGLSVNEEVPELPSDLRDAFEEMIVESVARTGVTDDPERLLTEFLDGGFIDAYVKERFDREARTP